MEPARELRLASFEYRTGSSVCLWCLSRRRLRGRCSEEWHRETAVDVADGDEVAVEEGGRRSERRPSYCSRVRIEEVGVPKLRVLFKFGTDSPGHLAVLAGFSRFQGLACIVLYT